ncbi:MAG: DUF87 domain-containing protein, partial [Conexivisphaerales archaeon]
MRILTKQNDELRVLAMQGENINKGDYLKIYDKLQDLSLVVQVYDIAYFDSLGIEEDILRDELFSSSEIVREDPLQTENLGLMIKDARVLICKIRGVVKKDRKENDFGWLPSRSISKIAKLGIEEVAALAGSSGERSIKLGYSLSGEEFSIHAEDLDGRLNVITGRKEAGKSHLAKLLVSGLIDHGARVLVLDINGE